MRRCLTIVLAILVIMSALPITAMAADGDPIEIRTIEDLYLINNNMSGNYILMNDLDMTEATAKGGDWDFDGRGWDPIGSNGKYVDIEFTGTFDGNGHSIKGMRIEASTFPSGTGSNLYFGLFARNRGTIKNLHMVGGSVTVGIYNSCDNISSIVAINNGTIHNCSSSVNVKNTEFSNPNISGDIYLGGICGYNSSSGVISECYNTGNIEVRQFGADNTVW